MEKTAQQSEWRLLYFLNIYRILLSAFFSSLFYFQLDLSPFGNLDSQLFNFISLIYFSFSLFSNFTIAKQWPDFTIQTHLHLSVDIFAVFLLALASGGVSSGVALLLMVPIAASSIFQFRQMSYFYASLASLLLLGGQLYILVFLSLNPFYTQAGILGVILFFTALITNYLARKLQDTQALASQIGEDLVGMEKLAIFVMQRLQVPVIVVDNKGLINLKNEASSQLFDKLQKKKLDNLSDFSPTLFSLFKNWQSNKKVNGEKFFLENSSIEMLAQFSLLQKKHSSDIIIFLEDVSRVTQLAQQQKLASLGRLTASIAHEIRNPLAAISHAGELLAESQLIDEADKRLTQIIDQQSKRLNEIIDTVLNLSRRHQMNTEKINLTQWINKFLEDQIHFPAQRMSLIVKDNFIVSFDSQHLHQILSNLIQNALRHSTSVTTTKDNLPPITIKIYKEEQIIIDVLNYGERITSNDEQHLFEPFFTTQSSGTGLGLYMAKELADSNYSLLSYIPFETQTCFRLIFAAKL